MNELSLPESTSAALAKARTAYLAGDFAGAERANGEALVAAEAAGSAEGAVRARRYLGLCAYRRGENELSARLLEEVAVEAGGLRWADEELLVSNHLGATYRKLGRLDDADRVFREALLRADARHHLVARTRLLGSYGAFLDDLGDASAAGEQYARHEELLSLLDDPGRLANAHGLVSRAARERGDLPTAEAKAREEIRLGALAKLALREGRGWMHLAQALAAQGDADSAASAFAAADALLATAGDIRAPIGVACARARFFLGSGRLQASHEEVLRASGALGALGPTEHEHRARVSEVAAEVASAAGLHGEALWHMGNSLDSQLARFEPIADVRLRGLTRGRRDQLAILARRLLGEAGAVERGMDESERVEALLLRLGDFRPSRDAVEESVSAWRTRVRREAEQRWSRLLPVGWGALPPGVREELVLSDVLSAGPVGDLSRGLFLLFTVVERVIRERLVQAPGFVSSLKPSSALGKLARRTRPAGLGEMLAAILDTTEPGEASAIRSALRRNFGAATVLEALRALREPTKRVDGAPLLPPVQWRNEVAHGGRWDLTRLDGDAVRRGMTLGASAPIRALVEAPSR